MPVLKSYSIAECNADKLHKSIDKKNCVANFQGVVVNGDTVDILGDSLTSQSDLDNLVTNHDPAAETLPRIISLASHEAKHKHFHNIDYKKELTTKLQLSLTFGEPGLLTMARWFEDEALQLPVLDVLRDYDSDNSTGQLIKKKSARVYYNSDFTVHEEIKDPGWYFYTPEESREATHRRRKNITNKLEADMLAMLMAAAGGDPETQAANLDLGGLFMAALTPAINIFHLSGNNGAIADLVSAPATHSLYPFLISPVAPGVLAWQFIIAGVTY